MYTDNNIQRIELMTKTNDGVTIQSNMKILQFLVHAHAVGTSLFFYLHIQYEAHATRYDSCNGISREGGGCSSTNP